MAERRRVVRVSIAICGTLAGIMATAFVATADDIVAGPRPDGTAYTSQGWHVTPAGTQTRLGPGTLDLAMSPRGDLLLAVNAGYLKHSLMAIDPATGRVLQTIREQGGHNQGPWQYEAGHAHGYYVGVAFSPDGRRAWASSGSGDALHAFRIRGTTVDEVRRVKLGSNVGNDHVYPA